MKLFHILRRFHKQNEDFIFTEMVCVLDDLIKVIEFIDNEVEIKDESKYKHLDTYVVCSELNKMYTNILREKHVLKKQF